MPCKGYKQSEEHRRKFCKTMVQGDMGKAALRNTNIHDLLNDIQHNLNRIVEQINRL